MTNETKEPYLRVSDINYIVTNEIYTISNGKINFTAAKKDDNEAAINNLRIMLAGKKIIINPRCETLIRHLRNVRWASAKNKQTFGRSPDNGHYDAVDALKYAVRSIIYSKNPYPPTYDLNTKDLYIHNSKNFYSNYDPTDIYRKMFGLKRKG